ncbi:hypothetical protein [Marispirochaeta sp.]|uniref:hypothetical protein n=1 Tax=Marispirochaeta sp. TaxID=2038653 RepID=UPI0029C91D61|nr:hypothetical protein [Marispirochaeta sp.]
MQKMQILFPDPQIARLRRIATSQDRPVSELVRSAVDFWLSRYGDQEPDSSAKSPPVYSCGDILVQADMLRENAYEDRDLV